MECGYSFLSLLIHLNRQIQTKLRACKFSVIRMFVPV